LNRLQADFRQALHEKDGLARQVSVLEQELRTTSQRLDEATAARVTLETKIATLDAKLSAANLELTSLRLIKEAVDAAESKLAAVCVKEDVAEREEEREMGQKRMYRPSVRQSPRVASEIGEGKAEGDLYEFDVAFQFDSGSSGDADDTSVLVATAAAQIAQTRADRSIEWATSTEIAGLVPNMSTAARRLASWLRAAGTCFVVPAAVTRDFKGGFCVCGFQV
jgi:carbon monoxide dehydrogenase subunit G